MFRKIITIFIILLIISSIVYIFLPYIHSGKQENDLYKALPVNSAMFTEINDFTGFLETLQEESGMWQELTNIESIQKIDNQIDYIRKTMLAEGSFEEILAEQPVILSIHLTGKNNYDFLYLVSLKLPPHSQQLISGLKNHIQKYVPVKKRQYENTEIYEVKTSDNSNYRSFCFAAYKGIFMLSFHPLLVEDAIRQLNTENNIKKDEGYLAVKNTAGKNVDANIYINYKVFPGFISLFLDDKYKQRINSFTNFAGWSELDLNLSEDALLMNGFTCTNEFDNNYLNIFLEQQACEITIDRILPDNTSTLIAFGIDSPEKYFTDYRSFLEKSGDIEKYTNTVSSINKTADVNIESMFCEFMDKEICLAYTHISTLEIDQNIFLIIKAKSKSIAVENLTAMIRNYAQKKDENPEKYQGKINIDEEKSYPVYQLPFHNIFSTLFGNIFAKNECQYFTFLDNYVIFGTSKKSLSKFIHYKILGKTLHLNINYKKMADNLSENANFYFYSNIINSPRLFSMYLNEEMSKNLDNNLPVIRKFHAVAYQFMKSKDMVYNNLYLRYYPDYKEDPHTLWSVRLDTLIDFKPELVINHYTYEKEIFIQDLAHNIYLINNIGRILWKIPLKEKIVSDIYQIDFYNNNKKQLLFNTKNEIHLIDRNGNYVERYPVRLRSPATNGIALFDYENNKDYRIFVACENKKVYDYNKEGEILDGWEFDKTEHPVINKLQHFRVGTKDYIVFADKYKTYILDRKGNTRVKPSKNFEKSPENLFYIEHFEDDKARLITSDVKGNVKFLYFNGTIEEHTFKEYSAKHYFMYNDLDGDRKSDYIFLDKKKLETFSHQKKPLFEHTFEQNITHQPAHYIFSSTDRKIGIASSQDCRLFLFNKDGALYKGFPLTGCTPFTIGFLKKNSNFFNMIVGGEDNHLYIYEIK